MAWLPFLTSHPWLTKTKILIRSTRRATRRNFNRTKGEVSSCEEKVTGLKAQVDVTKRQLKTIQPMQGRIHEVAKSNKKSEALHRDEKSQRQTANGSCFKFFSIESLHNWALTGYSDSSTSLVFCGLSAETSIQLSFSIFPLHPMSPWMSNLAHFQDQQVISCLWQVWTKLGFTRLSQAVWSGKRVV